MFCYFMLSNLLKIFPFQFSLYNFNINTMFYYIVIASYFIMYHHTSSHIIIHHHVLSVMYHHIPSYIIIYIIIHHCTSSYTIIYKILTPTILTSAIQVYVSSDSLCEKEQNHNNRKSNHHNLN